MTLRFAAERDYSIVLDLLQTTTAFRLEPERPGTLAESSD